MPRTIVAGRKSGAIEENSATRVALDTTVMEKTIAYPTDARLCERAQLTILAQEAGVDLHQTYAKLAPRLAPRLAPAKQFRRMRKALKRLNGHTGRVMHDLRRHVDDLPAGALREPVLDKLALVFHRNRPD